MAYAIEKIQCPSPDDLSKSLNITSPPLVTRQQGATQVSCLVVIPHGYMFSMLSLKNKGQLSDSVLPVLEEQAQFDRAGVGAAVLLGQVGAGVGISHHRGVITPVQGTVER